VSRNGVTVSVEQDPGVQSAERQGLFYAIGAVLFFSLSPVLTRWAAVNLSAYEIAAGRLFTAGIVVLGLAGWQGHKLPARQDWPRFVLFGLITACHFALYIGSLQFTTIAHSLALLYTAPIFVAILAWFWLGERLSARKSIGVLVAVLGISWLTGFEPAFTRQMLWGDLLAVGSAICYALYSVAGRSQRDRTSLFGYAATVYLLASLWLFPLAIIHFQLANYTGPALLSVLALGLFPLALGHTLYNAALRHTNATLVNLIATQEITGGILLGMVLLGEMPSLNSGVGVIITLVGIVLVVL
jgi:drug/metabolite transporter (DMT)-like permease